MQINVMRCAGIRLVGAAMATILVACSSLTEAESPSGNADSIYFGGSILTMRTDTPTYAEAIAVKDGKILAVGARSDIEAMNGQATRIVDLQGKTLLPGFIDAHGHVWSTGIQALAANLLPPPDGDGSSIDELVRVTQEWAAENPDLIEEFGMILGFGYDEAQLAERRRPTADELDRISTDVPVVLLTQDSHTAAVNHKALEHFGYDASTPDPAGGVIQRKPGSQEPSGVLEEAALFGPLFKMLEVLSPETNQKIALAGIEAYIHHGFTTAQDGRSSRDGVESMRALASQGELSIDVVAYPDLTMETQFLLQNGTSREYRDRFRIGGAKLSLDGAIQSRTGWLTEPYKTLGPGHAADYRGYAAIADDTKAQEFVNLAYEHDWQLLAHNNGDAATDQLIRLVRQAGERHGATDRRTVGIHSQMIREDQLDAFKALGIIPSFFSMHTYYWGDWHREATIGPERANRISPAQSALHRGMLFTEHHDAPVALPSAMVIVHTAVNRTSRSGVVIGEDQRISPYIALKSITDWAAYQYFEEDRKGTLVPGKLADLVILDKDPLKVAPDQLRDIQIVATIKEGEVVYATP